MNRYIAQLAEDMRKQRQVVRPPDEIWDSVDIEDPGEVEDMAHAEELIYGDEMPLDEITGIEHHMLPPPEKLNDEQAAVLATEIELLLNHYNLYPGFPDHYPLYLRYPFLRNLWEQQFVPVSFGQVQIELCDYDDTLCPFPGYCTTCEEFRQEEASGAKAGDLPDDFDAQDLLNIQPPWVDEP